MNFAEVVESAILGYNALPPSKRTLFRERWLTKAKLWCENCGYVVEPNIDDNDWRRNKNER